MALTPSINNSNYTKAPALDFIKSVDNTGVCKDVITNVNSKLDQQSEGRLFAIVHLCGKQFKVTTGDVIVVEGYWPPTTGDQIRLDKVKSILSGSDLSVFFQ